MVCAHGHGMHSSKQCFHWNAVTPDKWQNTSTGIREGI